MRSQHHVANYPYVIKRFPCKDFFIRDLPDTLVIILVAESLDTIRASKTQRT
jgi:hypothetical protein